LKNQGIYRIENTENGKFYVGSSVNLATRWSQHKYNLRRKQHCNKHLQNAWNKYGEDVFLFIIVDEIKEATELVKVEQEYLDNLTPYDREIGYNVNIDATSRLGVKNSDTTNKKGREAHKRKTAQEILQWKARISAAKTGVKMSQESKDKISKALKGKSKSEAHIRNLTGMKHSEESLGKMRGRVFSEETREKISRVRRGKHHTEEAKKKLSVAHTGKKLSEEHKLKISKSLKGHVVSQATRVKISHSHKTRLVA
jgi:group I intron endonuclease